jgi:hypothetical protein
MRRVLCYPCGIPLILMLLVDGVRPTPRNEDHAEMVNIGIILSFPHTLMTVIYHRE